MVVREVGVAVTAEASNNTSGHSGGVLKKSATDRASEEQCQVQQPGVRYFLTIFIPDSWVLPSVSQARVRLSKES